MPAAPPPPLPPVLAYRVPYADTDQMGVVYYANFLVLFERARNELLRLLHLPYKRIEAEGRRLPVIEAVCHYLRPAHYDDLLLVHAWGLVLSPVRLRVDCQVWREATLLAHGHTVHVWTDHQGRPARLLPDWATCLGGPAPAQLPGGPLGAPPFPTSAPPALPGDQ